MTMVSWFACEVGDRLQAPAAKHQVQTFHENGVHFDALGEGQLAQLVVHGGRQIDGLLNRPLLPAGGDQLVGGLLRRERRDDAR